MYIGDLFEDGNRKRLIERKAKLLRYSMYLREDNTPLRDKDDYKAKLQALKQILADPDTARDPKLRQAVQRRLGQLHTEAEQLGIMDEVNEDGSELSIGDPVIITGNVNFSGKTGDIAGFGQDKKFIIVNLYNHGKHSFHSSNVEANDYADSDAEENDMNDDDPDFRRWADSDAVDDNLGEHEVAETSDYFRRREREEAIISGKKPARKKSPAQTSDYATRREQEKKQGVAEGGVLKSIKRGLQGWDKSAIGPGGEKLGDPKDVVRRNKGYDDATVKSLSRDIDFGSPFGGDKNQGDHSPRGLQKRVLNREIKRRGLEEGDDYTAIDDALKQSVEQMGGRAWFNGGSYTYLLDVRHPNLMVTSDGAKIKVSSWADGIKRYADRWVFDEIKDMHDMTDFMKPAKGTGGQATPRGEMSEDIAPAKLKPGTKIITKYGRTPGIVVGSKYHPGWGMDGIIVKTRAGSTRVFPSTAIEVASKELAESNEFADQFNDILQNFKADQAKKGRNISVTRGRPPARPETTVQPKQQEPVGNEERDRLQAELKSLEAKFDPNYDYSDDYTFWSEQNQIGQQIASIKKRLSLTELSKDTLKSYQQRVSQDSMKNRVDPSKRNPNKASRSVAGFAKAGKRLDQTNEATNASFYMFDAEHINTEESANGGSIALESKGINKRVTIWRGPDDVVGKEGWISEIRQGLYKGAPKTYTVDYKDDNGNVRSIQLPGKNLRLWRKGDEGSNAPPVNSADLVAPLSSIPDKKKRTNQYDPRHDFPDAEVFKEWENKSLEENGVAAKMKKPNSNGFEAHGVKGMNSTPWRKTFKNREAYEKWLDQNEGQVEVHATRDLDDQDRQIDEVFGFGKKPVQKRESPEERQRKDAAWAAAKKNIEANKEQNRSHWQNIDTGKDKTGKARAVDHAWGQGIKEGGSVIGGGDPGDSTASPVGSVRSPRRSKEDQLRDKIESLTNRLGMAKERRGTSRIQSQAEVKLRSKIDQLQQELHVLKTKSSPMAEEIEQYLSEMKKDGYDV